MASTRLCGGPSTGSSPPYPAARRCSRWSSEPSHAVVARAVAAPRLPWPRPVGAYRRALAQVADTATAAPPCRCYGATSASPSFSSNPRNPETADDPQFDYGVDDMSFLPEQPGKPSFDHQIS
ncbi:uncharacterized protein [Triticum aestivum]|uniref:uncharacterized protein n=1 Tax=Triticum aestivum TaxID=4565 RepID=UPI001D02B2D0|nr:uncharacterized protein LOC123101299 [Triticum aestivum]